MAGWIRIVLASMLTMLFSFSPAQWWNFGKTEDPVSFKYIHVAGVSIEEIGPKLTLYKDLLPNGEVLVRGQGMVRKGQIGTVRFSLDGKENWIDAKVGDKGVFEFRFKGEKGRTYELYIEAMDTTGTTNPVDKTRTVIVISELDLREAVRQALEAMARAYMDENRRSFMKLIDEDFLGDKVTLDRAVGKDFAAFENLQLQLTLDSCTPNGKGLATAYVNYVRSLIGSKSGQNYKDNGRTRFAFRLAGEGVLCYSMSRPLLFGLSDAGNVGTDNVNTNSSDNVLVINNGDIGVVSFKDAAAGWSDGTSASTETGRVTLRWDESNPDDRWFESFTFEDKLKQREESIAPRIDGNFGCTGISFHWNTNLGTKFNILYNVNSLDEVKTAPDSGWESHALFPLYDEGIRVIAFHMGGTKYAVIEILDMIRESDTAGRIVFRYKYTANGPGF